MTEKKWADNRQRLQMLDSSIHHGPKRSADSTNRSRRRQSALTPMTEKKWADNRQRLQMLDS
ncbi:MAG: hypothetical protein WCT12_15300, partial [Verrucomicrobiota bacterium]